MSTTVNRIIFGNGGKVVIDEDGTPLDLRPSIEVQDGEHDGYADIVAFDIKEWREHYGYAVNDGPEWIDVLDIGYTTDKGYYEPPCADHRDHMDAGDGVIVVSKGIVDMATKKGDNAS